MFKCHLGKAVRIAIDMIEGEEMIVTVKAIEIGEAEISIVTEMVTDIVKIEEETEERKSMKIKSVLMMKIGAIEAIVRIEIEEKKIIVMIMMTVVVQAKKEEDIGKEEKVTQKHQIGNHVKDHDQTIETEAESSKSSL